MKPKSKDYNRDSVAFHLGEAAEEIASMLDANRVEGLDRDEFLVRLEHAYHHLNSAYHSRNRSVWGETDDHFMRDRKFPRSIVRSLGVR